MKSQNVFAAVSAGLAASVGNQAIAAMTDVAKTATSEAVGLVEFVAPVVLFVFLVIGIVRLNRGPAPLIISVIMIGLYVGVPMIMTSMGLESPI